MENLTSINWLAVLIAAIASFILGAIWYNPKVFGTMWMKELQLTEKDMEGANMGKIFGVSFILYLIGSLNLALFLGKNPNIVFGTLAGFFAGLGWVSTAIGINYLFERRSFKLWVINAGYGTLSLTLMGLILGLM